MFNTKLVLQLTSNANQYFPFVFSPGIHQLCHDSMTKYLSLKQKMQSSSIITDLISCLYGCCQRRSVIWFWLERSAAYCESYCQSIRANSSHCLGWMIHHKDRVMRKWFTYLEEQTTDCYSRILTISLVFQFSTIKLVLQCMCSAVCKMKTGLIFKEY